MELFFNRYRNLVVLLALLLAQVIGLAVQVRKPSLRGTAAQTTGALGAPALSRDRSDGAGVRLIRIWAADVVTPFERMIHGTGEGLSRAWTDYVDLRRTREENKDLQKTIDRLRLEQAMLVEDARQGQRLQQLMQFRENYIYKTLPAQVIGTSGSRLSHVIWLDKGSNDGLKPDMAVITADGIVGKIREVFPSTSQVLEINDQTSGAGVVLQTTRTRGILRGNANGQPQVINVLADRRIQPGEQVLTAGGDQIFPRGLPVGVVQQVVQDQERGSFIDIILKPAANLQHLDEVLVITSLEAHLSPQQEADLTTSEALKGAEVAADEERKKAAIEMGERLPGLKDPPVPGVGQETAGQDKTGQDKTGQDKAGQDKSGEDKTGQVKATDKSGQAKAGDEKPVSPAAVAAKPIPAKHPDRFSPGSSLEVPDANSSGHSSGSGAEATADGRSGQQGERHGGSEPRPNSAVKPTDGASHAGRSGDKPQANREPSSPPSPGASPPSQAPSTPDPLSPQEGVQ